MRKVYELLDKTRSLLSFAGRASLYSGVVAGGDSPISVAYFGNGANLQFLIGSIFGGHCEHEDLGSIRIWQGSAFSREWSALSDLVVFDIPWPWEVTFDEASCVVEVPAWVRQSVSLPADRNAFIASLHRSVRGEQMRKIRKHGLIERITRDEKEIRDFYRTMYVPHVLRRFGPDATVVAEARMLKYAKRGALLQVFRGRQFIAGSVLSRSGDSVQSLWSGFAGEDLRALDGATSALFYYLVGFAFDHGCHTVDYCGSRPLLSDGVFEIKRRWGASVHDDWSLDSLLLQFNRFDAGVRQLLGRCPWITRQGEGLVGKVLRDGSPLTAEAVEKEYLRLACKGLDGLHLYALAGIHDDARLAVDRSDVPVRLFDLRDDDHPLKTYCDR